ncbi:MULTISPECIES: hypothetical protein [Lysinibacillus]|uniref:hypothetical protein n=1 Tax=Lysinibacillus TaxID=400634 RepID=UPI0025944154|nr:MULTISPECIES: hypothetical protein [Lysinibacillus]
MDFKLKGGEKMLALAIVSICTMIFIFMMALLSIFVIYKKVIRKQRKSNKGD